MQLFLKARQSTAKIIFCDFSHVDATELDIGCRRC
jgi:hypothetical protein